VYSTLKSWARCAGWWGKEGSFGGRRTVLNTFIMGGVSGLVEKGGLCDRHQRHAWQTVEYIAPRFCSAPNNCWLQIKSRNIYSKNKMS
jgi:hypothetical protein